MAQVQIFTQSELNELNLKLDQMAKNLSVHVNGSLSKVHGLNLLHISFNNDVGNEVGDYVLVFQFGVPPDNTTLYVPARILSSGDPGPYSTSDGSLGSISISGVPILPKSLITESPSADALAQAEIYNQLLLTHSNSTLNDTTVNQDHGGTSYALETTLDSLGHKIGSYTVTIGVNGLAVKLPADMLTPVAPAPGPPPTPVGGLLYTAKTNPLSGDVNKYNWCDNGGDNSQVINIKLTLPTYYLPFTAIYQVNGFTPYPITRDMRNLTADFTLTTDWADFSTGAGGESGSLPAHHGQGAQYTIGNDNLTLRLNSQYFDESPDKALEAVRVKFTASDRTWYSNTVMFSGNDDSDGFNLFYNVPYAHLPGPII